MQYIRYRIYHWFEVSNVWRSFCCKRDPQKEYIGVCKVIYNISYIQYITVLKFPVFGGVSSGKELYEKRSPI